MRILLINSVCGVGSTGRICTDIADVLSKEGHDVKIAYGRGSAPEKYREIAIPIGNKAGIALHVLKTRLFDLHGFGSRHDTEKFISQIKDFNPDVIHLHNIHGYYINIDVLFKFLKEYKKPVIWTLHDCWAFTGHCSYFDTVKCDKWENGCFACPLKKDYPASFLADRSKKNYRDKKNLFINMDDLTVVTPSKWLAGLVRRSFMGSYSVLTIPNGISTDVFRFRKSRIKEKFGIEGKKLILGVANIWSETKGISDFVKLSHMTGEDYAIMIVGRIPQKEKYDLNGIIRIDHTDSAEELAEFYSAADYFFNPTRQDNYPTVNLEAGACGTPVISYRTGGSPEGVFKGTVVEQGDYQGAFEWMKEHQNTDRETEGYIKEIERSTMVNRYCELITSAAERGAR